ncbi:MAG: MFS transporter [Gammaproteobacteria bacterium]|nr:MFS transporter [Gammaproteobacteria bacterium]
MTEKTEADRRRLLFVVVIASFTTPLMIAPVAVGVPAMAGALHVSTVTATWIMTIFFVASAVFVLPFGRLADVIGRRRVFASGLALCVLTSSLAAFADSVLLLLVARSLQGIAAAMLYSTTNALVAAGFPPARRGAAIGINVTAIYLGLTAGPLVGGWVIEQFGWQSVFLCPVPLALVSLLLSMVWLTDDEHSTASTRFDYAGGVLFGIAIIALLVGFSWLPGAQGWGLVALGLAVAAVFVLVETRQPAPVLEVSLFLHNRTFLYSCSSAFLSYASMFTVTYLVSLYLQSVTGTGASRSGLILMIQPLMMTLLSPVAGRLSDRVEPRTIASIGMAVMFVGFVVLSGLELSSSLLRCGIGVGLIGVGFALFSSPNINAIMGSVERRQFSVATATVAVTRLVGQSFGMGLITVVFALALGPLALSSVPVARLNAAIGSCFLVAGAMCAAGMFASLARGPRAGTD